MESTNKNFEELWGDLWPAIKRFWSKSIWTKLLVIFISVTFWPLLILLLTLLIVKKFKNPQVRWGLIILLWLFSAPIVFTWGKSWYSGLTASQGDSTTSKEEAQQSVKETPKESPAKVLSYEVLQRWEIRNGGEGKTVLIPRDYLNESYMTALGDKLKNDTKDDRNAFIMVFTDKRAAELRDKVLSNEFLEADRDFYDTHYVGQYTKNANSALNQFVVYFDGTLGTNTKTIKY